MTQSEEALVCCLCKKDIVPGDRMGTVEGSPGLAHVHCIESRPGADPTRAAANAPDHIMQFFAYRHLPPELQQVSAPFGELAKDLVVLLPRNPERTVALRKLLESKDAAVRARIADNHTAMPFPPAGRTT